MTNRHLSDIHFTDRHLADRHLADRHLAGRHLTKRHFAVRHLTNRHFMAGRHFGWLSFGQQSIGLKLSFNTAYIKQMSVGLNGFRKKGVEPFVFPI
jgi:hypothetical protein